MAQKPTPPPQNLRDQYNNAVKLETTVNGLLHHGQTKKALEAFENNWETTTLSNLPLRHPFRLQRVDTIGLRLLVSQDNESKKVSFSLKAGLDKQNPKEIAVLVETEEQIEVVGFLGKETQEMLARAGEGKEFYEVKPLQLSGLQSGDLKFDMELVRPDLRQCSACNKLHLGDQINCEECRKKRRRKQAELHETLEQSSVPMQAALRKLSAQPDLL